MKGSAAAGQCGSAAAEWTPLECPGCRERLPDGQAMVTCRRCWSGVPEPLRDAWFLAGSLAEDDAACRAIVRHFGVTPGLWAARRTNFRATRDLADAMWNSPYRSVEPRMRAVCAGCGLEAMKGEMEEGAGQWWHDACLERAADAEMAALEGEHKATKRTKRAKRATPARVTERVLRCIDCGAEYMGSSALWCPACTARRGL